MTWIRRSRISADGWDGPDIPLGESQEAYSVRLTRAATVLRQASVSVPRWTVPLALWDQAVAGGSFAIEIAQLSDEFGPGPFIRREIHV